jgi:hypothetical protein
MEIKRKVQFGAVAVIANGLLALSALDPGVALASSCPDLDVCLPFCNTEGINMYCQGSTPGHRLWRRLPAALGHQHLSLSIAPR